MGIEQRKVMKFAAAWQMKTTRMANAYESIAASRSLGSKVGIAEVVCLAVIELCDRERRFFSPTGQLQ